MKTQTNEVAESATTTKAATAAGNGEVGTGQLTVNPTPFSNPNMPHQSVTLFTNEILDNSTNSINQGYTIIPNFAASSLSISGMISFIYKFGSSNYGIKFSIINGKNKIYVTYVKRDYAFAGSYKDYTTNVPTEWVNAAIAHWGGSTTASVITKSVSISFKGVETAFSDEIGMAYFQFKYTRVPQQAIEEGN